MENHKLKPLVYVGLVLILGTFASAKADDSAKVSVLKHLRGESFDLDVGLSWINSGAWDVDGRKLFVLDAINRNLLELNDEAAVEGHVDLSQVVAGTDVPRSGLLEIQPIEQGFMLQFEGDLFRRVDSSFRPLTDFMHLQSFNGPRGEQVVGIFDWAIADKDTIVAIADYKAPPLRSSPPSWKGGVVSLDLTSATFSVLCEWEITSAERQYYLMGYPFIAAKAQQAVFAWMKQKPMLVGFDLKQSYSSDDGVEISGFDLGIAPPLPKVAGISSFTAIYDALARTPGVRGVYIWEDSLFVLIQQRSTQNGEYKWSLLRQNISGTNNEPAARFALETNATHLNLIPGKEYFALIEKGKVRGLGDQDIYSIRRIRTEDLFPARAN